jgi:hypothetical protein
MPKRVRDEMLEPSSDAVLYDKVRVFQSEISNWKRASPRVLEQLRTFILDHRDQLGALAKAAEDVISARKLEIRPALWNDVFQLGRDTKPREGQTNQRKHRAITSIKMIWGQAITDYYDLGSLTVKKLEIIRKCAMEDPDFNQFPKLANLIMVRRHEEAMLNNSVACVTRDKHSRLSLSLEDLTILSELALGKSEANDKHGRQLTLDSLEDGEEEQRVNTWAECQDGDFLVRGQPLRELRTGHHLKYLLQRDDYGMLAPRLPTISPVKMTKTNGNMGPRTTFPDLNTQPSAKRQRPCPDDNNPVPAAPPSESTIAPKSSAAAASLSPLHPAVGALIPAITLSPTKVSLEPSRHEWQSRSASVPPPSFILKTIESHSNFSAATITTSKVTSTDKSSRSTSVPIALHGEARTIGSFDDILVNMSLTSRRIHHSAPGPLAHPQHNGDQAVSPFAIDVGGDDDAAPSTPDVGLPTLEQNAPPPGSRQPSPEFNTFDACTVPQPVLPVGCSPDQAVILEHWNRRIHETERQAPHHDLKKWIHPVRFAQENEDCERIADDSCCDVNRVTWETFRRLAVDGSEFKTPLIIKETFPDAQEYSITAYTDSIERAFCNSTIDVRYHHSGPKRTATREVVEMLRSSEDRVLPEAPNLLNLSNLSRAIAPGLTRLSRFRLLDYLNHATKSAYIQTSGKQTFLTPFDMGASESFDIFGLSGAFSGGHVDFLGGTWLRNLFGVKVWMIVPERLMTEEDWSAFGKDGASWDPQGKSRAIILQQGDVFFMPPGLRVIHAVHTLDTCLMNGGMLWDDRVVAPLLRVLRWIALHQESTNEAIPFQLGDILFELERRSKQSPHFMDQRSEIFEAIKQLRELGCPCHHPCKDSICPCYQQKRRCTPLCETHTLLEAADSLPCTMDRDFKTPSSSPAGGDSEDGDDSGEYR